MSSDTTPSEAAIERVAKAIASALYDNINERDGNGDPVWMWWQDAARIAWAAVQKEMANVQ